VRRFVEKTRLTVEVFCAAVIFLAIAQTSARAESVEHTNLFVVVKDAETGQPINQARLTLQFREPGKKLKPKLPHRLSYSAKTNPQGRYRFTNIPKGTVRLIVTADQHQALGKDYELERDNQVIEVLLKKPQPLL
jgi:carboxypeptidase family protein